MVDDNLQLDDLTEEMIIRDEEGNYKILKDGKLLPYPAKITLSLPQSALPKEEEKEVSQSVIKTAQGHPALQPPVPATISKKGAAFYFAPEDEEEVAKIKLPKDTIPSKKYSLDKILTKVIVNNEIENLSEEIKSRLKNAIFSYLRDRRTFVDMSEILKRSQSNGGLEFDQLLAEKIMSFLKEVKDKITQEKGLVIKEEISKIALKEQLVPPVRKVPPVVVDIPKPKEVEIKARPPKIELIKKVEPIKIKKQVKALPVKQPVRPQRAVKEGKVAMRDVRKDYKLVGPVEELVSLSLQTLHRLASKPQEQVQKILEKINRLGEDSLAKKTAGIQGWRRSPLYKMYLAIGQASMEHGVSVKDIINQYHAQGKDILTMEEFETISDINKKLRF
ncbi:hypothetical protein KKF32_02140 [Patescibacteria group bacterium]|nr:hypothetical protein [Patescibacteria group bacterium]